MANGQPASCLHRLRKYESDSTLLQRHICVRRLTRPKYPPVPTQVFAFAVFVHEGSNAIAGAGMIERQCHCTAFHRFRSTPMHSNLHEVRMNIVTNSSKLFRNWDETELTVNSKSEFKFNKC